MNIKHVLIVIVFLLVESTDCMIELETPANQLFRGAQEGKLGLVKSALDARVDVNVTRKDRVEIDVSYEGFTPLMHAAEYGQDEIVKYLLKAKAHINQRNEYGDTALRIAAGSRVIGTSEVVQILLNAKANPNLVESWTGTTALSATRNIEMIQLLLQFKADPNIRHKDSSTFLMDLFEEDSCKENLVDILLKVGADVNLQDSTGMNVLMRAMCRSYCNKKTIIKFLKAGINLLQVDMWKNNVLSYMKRYKITDQFIKTLIERLIVQQKRQVKGEISKHLLPDLANIVFEYLINLDI